MFPSSAKKTFSNSQGEQIEFANENHSNNNDVNDYASIDSWSNFSGSGESSSSYSNSDSYDSISDSQSEHDRIWDSYPTKESTCNNIVFRNRGTSIKSMNKKCDEQKPQGGTMRRKKIGKRAAFYKLKSDAHSYMAHCRVVYFYSTGWQRLCSKKSTAFLLISFLIWLYVQIKLINSATKRSISSSHHSLFPNFEEINITQLREVRRMESLKALGESAGELFSMGSKKSRRRRSGGAKIEKLPPGCVATSWQTYSFPNCNDIHDIDLQDALHMSRFGPKLTNMANSDTPIMAVDTEEQKQNAMKSGYVGMGLWRQVWKVDPRSEMQKKSFMGSDIPAVLKMMKSEHDLDQRNFDRHRRDALVMERLTSSKYVVSIYGFCGNSVLTAYAGRTLRDFLKEPTKEELQIEKYNRETSIGKLQLALDVVRGVKTLHEIDGGPIIHADIQSQQFLFDPMKGVQINDFNRCRLVPHHESTGSVCKIKIPQAPGKTRSPEEYERAHLTEKLDIFSLGHILYAILVGEEPWVVNDTQKFIEKVKKGRKPSIPDEFLKPGTPEGDLSKLILRCYEYEAEKRINAIELATSIESIILREKNKTH